MSDALFDKGPPDTTAPTPELGRGIPRLRLPHRDQVEMQMLSLDQMLEAEHPARIVWQAVCELDLSAWLANIKAVEHEPGRHATDPRLLVALWVYATTCGIGHARVLNKLCGPQGEVPYWWLCGGVTLNYHTLSDFRSRQGEAWDRLITQIVGTLMHEGLVTLTCVAQDGMRVEADAGKSSFRRQATLEECLAEAREQVETLKQLLDEHPEELTKRQAAARERATREREARVRQAIENCQELQKQRETRSKNNGEPAKEARASTTDADARNMKFPNGGYGPGYNVQFCTTVESNIIVGVDVTNSGSDSEELAPMLEQLQDRYDKIPAEALVDGGFVSKEAIEAAAAKGCTVYAPPKGVAKQEAAGKNPYEKKKGDKPAVVEWRERMGTPAAKEKYKLRAQTAEWSNMRARLRGYYRSCVRGLAKNKTLARLYVVTHNLLQGAKLRAEAVMS